jgi:glycerol-3-phosphate dehydrogenase (NAD(P)+)
MSKESAVKNIQPEIAVLGAGSWGTALAILLAKNGQNVRLWGHDAAHIEELKKQHRNQRYLPDITLPETISFYSDLSAAIKNIQDVLLVVPSRAFAQVVRELKPFASESLRLCWGTKGVDPSSGELLHNLVSRELGEGTAAAALAGPSFAREVALGLPTAVTVASNDEGFAKDLVRRFMNNSFRVYTTSDMVGVEVCGLVKNILAIATGILDGLKLGSNATSAFITRGLAEMTRLGLAAGGKPQTFMGLAGVGDLILTCMGAQSRNRRFGTAIAAGKSKEQALKEIGQVVEGLSNLESALQLAKKYSVEMPISEQVYNVVYKGMSVQEAMTNLFAREARSEPEWY